jgi:hypothetical protein
MDNRIHRRELERHPGKSSKNSEHLHVPSENKPATHHASHVSPPAAPSSTDVAPMEIDAIRRGPISAAEKDRRKRERLCFYCGQPGHNVMNCPNRSERAKRKDNKALPKSGKV